MWILLFLIAARGLLQQRRTTNFASLTSYGQTYATSRLVALTREHDCNWLLKRALSKLGVNHVVELPCIQFSRLVDNSRLISESKSCDIIAVTSPQAASLLSDAIVADDVASAISVASVGKGTSRVLIANGILPVFEPLVPDGENFARQLPRALGEVVFYPASELASRSFQDILEKRGFKVKRVNCYTTVEAKWTAEQESQARAVEVVSFASPSTARIWASRMGTNFTAISIGKSTHEVVKALGFQEAFFPQWENEKESIDCWARLIAAHAGKS